jgi:signal transduction histidine kinase
VAVWLDGQLAEPLTIPATTPLLRELLSGGRVFAPSKAMSRFPNDPLLLQLRAEAFVAEPLTDEHNQLLGFVALIDDQPFGADSDWRSILKALAPRAAVELAKLHDETEQRELAIRLNEAECRASAAESVLRDTGNLAAVGRMAAGLAHDLNNLLGVIVGNADLIRESLPDADPRRETSDIIAQTAQAVAAMTRKLLAIGRPGPTRAEPLDTSIAIRLLEPVLRRLITKRIALALELAPNLPLISADPTQFDRVILNLVLNARDATEVAVGSVGTITIRAAAVNIEPGRAGWPVDCAPGEYVAITVADTGCGMTEDVRSKMFNQFFSTKGDRGTGLGLTTVQEVVKAARGHIEVESEAGWGTQVRVYWPVLIS